MKRTRTPAPWTYKDNGFDGCIYDANGDFVCGGEPSEGRIERKLGQFIVRAVNAHEELLSLAYELRDQLNHEDKCPARHSGECLCIVFRVNQAIAKAEGK